jgi:chemotaxis protein methyltransferase CheR
MRDSEFEFIRNLVYERSRINLGPEKRDLVTARLGKRLRATHLSSIGDYCRLLRAPDAEQELNDLIDVISTNHTFFFRESAHFDFLRQHVIPEARARRQRNPDRPLTIWSAACASGEEPYSIAITLADSLPDVPWKVVASDISFHALEKARVAIYPEDSVGQLPAPVVQAHFQRGYGPEEGNVRLRPEIRQRVTFQQQNLLDADAQMPDAVEVIFCRNLMIYFDRPTQTELVARLTRHLIPGGYLFVGHAESLTHIEHTLKPVQAAVYRRAA